jgi:hypothetical protein
MSRKRTLDTFSWNGQYYGRGIVAKGHNNTNLLCDIRALDLAGEGDSVPWKAQCSLHPANCYAYVLRYFIIGG